MIFDIKSEQNQVIGLSLIAILHLVGLVGILSGKIPWILYLTPFNLLIATTTILFFHANWSKEAIGFMAICYVVGFGVEVKGVNTGVIFGEYSYGDVLGWQIWDTPLIIGLNWLMLIYSASSLVNIIFPTFSKVVRAILAALMMVALDVIIEPVAINLNFWTWTSDSIPLQNYIAWFFISLGLTISIQYLIQNFRNKVGAWLFIIQTVFFLGLWLFKT